AEEMITALASWASPSYRDLGAIFYQIQTKFRDEIRPRFGLLRAREFRMKDAYSFHVDEQDLDITYEKMNDAYSRIAKRCSLDVKIVEAPTGLIGGDVSHEFMVVSDVGEDGIVYCSECGYGADQELESHKPPSQIGSSSSFPLSEVLTKGLTSIEEVASFLEVEASRVIKCVLYVVSGKPLAVFVPGYREVSDAKLARILGTADYHGLREDERELFPTLTPGFTGPVGLKGVEIIFDKELVGAKGMVCGANREDYHLYGVEEGRDFEAKPAFDVASPVEGDLCIKCGSPLRLARGIEMGHIFKLGKKYSEPMKATFTAKNGEVKPIVMGTYGLGTTRMLAAVVEQHHDGDGIKWPKAVAPLEVELVVVNPQAPAQAEAASRLLGSFERSGLEVLLDDREVSPGVKFFDADLVGLPLQMIIGKNTERQNTVDFKLRFSGDKMTVSIDSSLESAHNILRGLP
ncbi:MAG: proline--tRNA ligase, partial [Actinomycetota bacterium]|nr:proline--tRNA ligase [Actinomycetota bacterium]